MTAFDSAAAQLDGVLRQLGLRTSNTALDLSTLVLTVVGAFSLALFFGRLLFVLLDVLVLPGKSLNSFKKKGSKDTWAVVTGATDGIGREFALQLGKKGFNVFLASRTPEKLGAVAGEIESKNPGVKTKTHAIDFANAGPAEYESLAKDLAGLEVGVLINNVGKSHDSATFFADTPNEELEDIIAINVLATLRVTKLVVPGMVERKKGLILNMGSFAGAFPTPLLATYSGSKSFLIGFTQSLAEEVRSKGVTVQLLNTFYVVSAMSKIRRSSAMVPTPKAYVAKALASIGKSGGAIGRAHTNTPWSMHALADWAISYLVPQRVMLGQSLKMQLDVKRRADRKKAKAVKSN